MAGSMHHYQAVEESAQPQILGHHRPVIDWRRPSNSRHASASIKDATLTTTVTRSSLALSLSWCRSDVGPGVTSRWRKANTAQLRECARPLQIIHAHVATSPVRPRAELSA